jgi:hypothetical protein
MWFAEDFARRGDYANMIHHVDIALRTSDSSQTAMFVLLNAAARAPQAATAIADAVRQRPSWARPFVVYAIGNAPDTNFVVELATLVLNPRKADDRAVYGALMQRLINAGDGALAWKLYGSPGMAAKGSTAAPIRSGGFETASAGPPFDWWFSQDAELWAAREAAPGIKGTVLRVGASDGRSGDVARQFLHLPAGSHILHARMGDLPDIEAARPTVRIECDSQVLVTLTPEGVGNGNRELSSKFTVPPACPFQGLHIAIAAGDDTEQQTPWVDDLRID